MMEHSADESNAFTVPESSILPENALPNLQPAVDNNDPLPGLWKLLVFDCDTFNANIEIPTQLVLRPQ